VAVQDRHLKPAGGGQVVAIGHDFRMLADDGQLRGVTGVLLSVS
jgi:hypothetical protein